MDNVEYAKIDAASKPICFHKSFLPVKSYFNQRDCLNTSLSARRLPLTRMGHALRTRVKDSARRFDSNLSNGN
jgi:hypothetical protein